MMVSCGADSLSVWVDPDLTAIGGPGGLPAPDFTSTTVDFATSITDIGAAIVEAFPNTVQGLIGAVGGLALWKALSGYDPGNT